MLLFSSFKKQFHLPLGLFIKYISYHLIWSIVQIFICIIPISQNYRFSVISVRKINETNYCKQGSDCTYQTIAKKLFALFLFILLIPINFTVMGKGVFLVRFFGLGNIANNES